jgi:hypothetical protein
VNRENRTNSWKNTDVSLKAFLEEFRKDTFRPQTENRNYDQDTNLKD